MTSQQPLISGAGGGGSSKSGVGASSSREDPNTLRTQSTAYVVDLLGEGEIAGLSDSVNPFKSVYLNQTPVQNPDGSFNFPGIVLDWRYGTLGQTYMPGATTDSPISLTVGQFWGGGGADGHTAQPWLGSIIETDADALRIIVSVPSLTTTDTAKGNLHGNSVDVRIEVRRTTGSDTAFHEYLHDQISGKCVSPYQRAYRVDLPKPGPWEIRVSRDTHEPTTLSSTNATFVAAVFKLLDEKFTYPYSAYIGLSLDAQAFNGQIPTRAYMVYGRKILIPTNYNPFTRIYSSDVWDGTFQYEWTDNPAWILYDLMTNARTGLGDLIPAAQVDKWSLYQIGRYCDGTNARPSNASNDYLATGKHGVPNGNYGFEPRFTFNGIINTRKSAYQVVQAVAAAMRGMTYWGAGVAFAVQDSPKDAVQLVAPANVVDGMFNYASSQLTDRHSVAIVDWTDPDNFYQPATEMVEHTEALLRYGYRETRVTAMGTTSRSQARRLGRWLLDTEFSETGTVTYQCGLDHMTVRPGQIVSIADPAVQGVRHGGRLKLLPDIMIGINNLISKPSFGSEVDFGGVGPWQQQPYGTTGAFAAARLWPQTPTQFAGAPWVLNLVNRDTYQDYDPAHGFAVTPGETIAAWAWLNATASSYAVGVGIRCDHGGGVYSWHSNNSSGGSDWQCVGGDITVPAGALRATPWLFVDMPRGITGVRGLASHIYVGRSYRAPGNGLLSRIRLDAPVSLEGGDTISIARANGLLMTYPVDYQAGPQEYLQLSGGASMVEIPTPGAMWVLEGGTTKTSEYRIMKIVEHKPAVFDVTATQYDKNKFARIEFDLIIPPNVITTLSTGPVNAPTALVVRENLYRANNSVRSMASISWTLAKDIHSNHDSRVIGYDVYILSPTGNWALWETTSTNSVEISDITAGAYGFRVYARTPNMRSPALEQLGVVIQGKSAPPADVTGFASEGLLNGTQLTWDAVTDLDLIGYEIRQGNSWDSGTVVIEAFKGTAVFMPLDGISTAIFWIKSKDDTGNYSVSAAAVTAQVALPADVPEMSAQAQEDSVTLIWRTVPGIEIEYEIRAGNTWDFGLFLGRTSGSSMTVLYPGTGLTIFWIKSRSKLGLYSLSAVFAEVFLVIPGFRNSVYAVDFRAAPFAGAKRNMLYDSSGSNTLSAQRNHWLQATSVGAGPNWGYANMSSLVLNAGTAPDGTTTATLTHEWSSSQTGVVGQFAAYQAGVAYTVRVCIKASGVGSARYLSILFDSPLMSSGFSWAMFDPSAGTVISFTSGIVASCTPMGNGWYECLATGTAQNSSVFNSQFRISSISTDPFANGTGDGVSGMYLWGGEMREAGQPVYGDYFEEIHLPASIRARNWLTIEFLMLDTNNLTWANSGFTWDSDTAANTAWIASGNDQTGAFANRILSVKQGTLPASLIDGWEFNGSLASIRSVGTTYYTPPVTQYLPHVARNGLRPNDGTTGYGAEFALAIPSTFTSRCTYRIQGGNPTSGWLDVLWMLGAAHSTSGTDHWNLMMDTSGNFVILDALAGVRYTTPRALLRSTDDYVTVVVSQTTTSMMVGLYSHHTGDFMLLTTPVASHFTPAYVGFGQGSVGMHHSIYTSLTSPIYVIGNLGVYSTVQTAASIEQFCQDGLAPLGYDPFQPFIPGDYSYQDAILGVMLGAPSGLGRPALGAYTLNIDVPDLQESGTFTASAGGWVTIVLHKAWIKPPFVTIYQPGGTTLAIGETQNVTTTSFDARLRSTSGANVAASAAYMCVGY